VLISLLRDPCLWELRSAALASRSHADALVVADLCEGLGAHGLAAEWREQATAWASTPVPCCPHPVARHAYNGCANCGCGVRWVEHPDRDRDISIEGDATLAMRRARRDERLRELAALLLGTDRQ
jgi:hypothetical protein